MLCIFFCKIFYLLSKYLAKGVYGFGIFVFLAFIDSKRNMILYIDLRGTWQMLRVHGVKGKLLIVGRVSGWE